MAGRNEIEILIKARDEASRALTEVNQKIRQIEGAAGGASGGMADLSGHMSHAERQSVRLTHGWQAMAKGMLAARVIMEAFNLAYESTIGLMVRGVKSIDDLRIAQASLGAAFATNDPSLPFDRAYKIAGGMVEKIQELDRAFIGTADELTVLADSMATFGMGIDLSTAKAQDQFVAFGNLLKLITRGQDFQRQAYQEIRSLMEGENVQGALLVKKLEAQGVNVKAMIPLWREQGTLIENIMLRMSGYGEASKKIEQSLTAQKSSLETITNKILREGMAGAYEDITGLIKSINDALLDEKGLTEDAKMLVDLMADSWGFVKTIVGGIGVTLQATVLPLIREMYDLIKKTRELQASEAAGIDPFGIFTGGEYRPERFSGADVSRSLTDFYGYDMPEELKTKGGKAGESDEAKRAREKAAKDRERETRKLHEALLGYEVEFWKNYDKAIIDGNEAINKYTRDQLVKRIEMERKGAERQEELNLRLKALRDEAATPVKWPWNERDVELMERMNEESVKFAENIRRLNKEFDKSERGEGPLMTKDQYEEAFRAYQDAYGAALGKVREETDVTTQHVADAWSELFNGLGGEISDVFFDAFKGKLDSLGDYMEAFTDIVRRAWSNLIADMITEQLKLSFGDMAKGSFGALAGLLGGGGSSTALAEVGGMTEGLSMFYGYKDGGIMPGGFMPIRAFAGGGIADRPTFGIIGEAGDSEAVIPLKGGKVPVEMRGGSRPANMNVTIVAADTRDMDRLLMDRRSLLVGMMADAMRNGAGMRDAIRRSV